MRKGMIAGGCLVFWGMAAAVFAGTVNGKQDAIQEEVAGAVVRFHVLAESDRIVDQKQKMLVKEGLLEEITTLLTGTDSLETTKEILKKNTKQLEAAAREILRCMGSDREVSVCYETDYFPEKTYGEYCFPKGRYETLRVKIGNARGHNWWCVLYPSLCFADALHPVLEEEENPLKEVLSQDAYDQIFRKGKIHFTFRWF